jgi:predicted AAA+ superfamily ATPase
LCFNIFKCSHINIDCLLGHPVAGYSWEGFVIEQIASTMPAFSEINFYRTAAGADLDVVLTTSDRGIGYEMKFSQAPRWERVSGTPARKWASNVPMWWRP